MGDFHHQITDIICETRSPHAQFASPNQARLPACSCNEIVVMDFLRIDCRTGVNSCNYIRSSSDSGKDLDFHKSR